MRVRVVEHIMRGLSEGKPEEVKYLMDYVDHMKNILNVTRSEDDWYAHEERCQRCLKYILKYEFEVVWKAE